MSWKLEEIELLNPIVLCGGMLNDALILKAIDFGIGAVTLGTYSSKALSSHPKPWLYKLKGSDCYVNSYGIRHSYFGKENFIKKTVAYAHSKKVKVICSYVEREPEISEKAVKIFEEAGCDIVEYNPTPLVMGCSGKDSGDLLDPVNLVKLISEHIKVASSSSSIPISVKFPSTISNVVRAWNQFVESGASIAHIMNAIVPAFVLVDGEKYFKTERGFGGMSGECVKPVSMARVKMLSDGGARNIIGTGGIMSLQDVQDYISSGASAVGVHSLIYSKGLAGLKSLIESSNKLFRA